MLGFFLQFNFMNSSKMDLKLLAVDSYLRASTSTSLVTLYPTRHSVDGLCSTFYALPSGDVSYESGLFQPRLRRRSSGSDHGLELLRLGGRVPRDGPVEAQRMAGLRVFSESGSGFA